MANLFEVRVHSNADEDPIIARAVFKAFTAEYCEELLKAMATEHATSEYLLSTFREWLSWIEHGKSDGTAPLHDEHHFHLDLDVSIAIELVAI